ncbi:MAG TPA: hypothetical protein VKE40_14985 [Gemmataceae bacterium]|nr:hypothetical protein [Gemmataceae bacterium]
MSDAPDPLEAELASIRPADAAPELKRRVAERLAESPPAQPRRVWPMAVVGGLIAACLAIGVIRWGSGRGVEPAPVVVPPPPQPAPAEVEDAAPMLLAYQRALARSPEELDALLDKEAAGSAEVNPDLVRVGPLTRSDATLHALLGKD